MLDLTVEKRSFVGFEYDVGLYLFESQSRPTLATVLTHCKMA